MQNEIAYSRPVTLTNILRFAVPTIAMSVFMSFYTMVDGLFVSNLIGTVPCLPSIWSIPSSRW